MNFDKQYFFLPRSLRGRPSIGLIHLLALTLTIRSMPRFLLLLFCASCAWLATPDASAAPLRHRYPTPGNHRPVYTYYRGGGSPHRSFSLFSHRSGTHKVKPHRPRRHRGTR